MKNQKLILKVLEIMIIVLVIDSNLEVSGTQANLCIASCNMQNRNNNSLWMARSKLRSMYIIKIYSEH